MNSNYSVDSIHNTMLENIDDAYQKTEGFPTYDITRGEAFALLELWKKAEEIERKQNVDNLTGDELTRVVFQRKGTQRKLATKAVCNLRIVDGNGTIHEGDLFESESGIQYESLENKDVVNNSIIKIRCTKTGAVGNVPKGTITQMPITIAGINAVINDDAAKGGENEEADDDLRERYYEELREPATSGNDYHYKQWAKEVEGVGEANVIGLWNGNNTVKVVIINSDRKAASTDLVKRVQDYIDPESKGIGEGQAPIGAHCTVVSATEVPINIDVRGVQHTTTATKSTITNDITEAVTAYLKKIAFKQNYVSVAQISNIIIDNAGVTDYESVTVNGQTTKINLTNEQVAVLGTVSVALND